MIVHHHSHCSRMIIRRILSNSLRRCNLLSNATATAAPLINQYRNRTLSTINTNTNNNNTTTNSNTNKSTSTTTITSLTPILPPSLQSIDTELQSLSDYSIGKLNSSRGLYSAAKLAFQRSLDIFHSMPDKSLLLPVLQQLSSVCAAAGEFQLELKYRLELFSIINSIRLNQPQSAVSQDSLLFIQSLTSLIITHWRLNQYQSSSKLLNQYTELFHSNNNSNHSNNNYYIVLFLTAVQHYLQSNFQLAIKQLQSLRAILSSNNNNNNNNILYGDSLLLEFYCINTANTAADSNQSELIQSAIKFYEQYYPTTVELPNGDKQLPLVQALIAAAAANISNNNNNNSSIMIESNLSRALKLTEIELGESHPSISELLRLLSIYYYNTGDAISSEGLLRTAINRLEHIQRPYQLNYSNKLLLLNSQLEYAHLLIQLEWNNQSRKPEANHWLQKCIVLMKQNQPYLISNTRKFPAIEPIIVETEKAAIAIPQSPFIQTNFTEQDYQLEMINTPILHQWIVDRYTS